MKKTLMSVCFLLLGTFAFADNVMNLADIYDYSYRQHRAFGQAGRNEVVCVSSAIEQLKISYPELDSQNIDARLVEFDKAVSDANPLFDKIRFYYATRDNWFNETSVIAIEGEPRHQELSQFLDSVQSNEFKLKKYLEAKNYLGTALFRSVNDLKLSLVDLQNTSALIEKSLNSERP